MRRSFLTIVAAALLASLAVESPTAAQATWRRGEIKATGLDAEREVKAANGDPVAWTTTIQPAQLPDTLSVGDELRMQVAVRYRYGRPEGPGYPKRIRITVTVGDRTAEDQTYSLVEDWCSDQNARRQMATSGTITLPVTSRIEPADADLERLIVTVRVGVALYCREPEGLGTSGLTVAYERGVAGPPSANAAPAVTLSTNPAARVFPAGQRFIVAAAASDDKDPPERLTYRWTVRNLETGVEQTARSTTLRQVRTRGRAAGKYEYKCVVTDTAGASSEATLAVAIDDAGDPEVVGMVFDDSTSALHHVTPYWQEGFPAIRRGEWALMLVSVRKFIAGAHFLRVFVDGQQVAVGAPGSAWAVQSLGGSTTERRVRLFVPPDVSIGKHTIEVAAIKRGTGGAPDTETSRATFAPQPIVLFNPWRSTLADVSVYANKPLSNIRATFYARGTQDLVMSNLSWDSVYDVTPYNKAVVRLAQEIVESMPETDRTDAGRVTAAMATFVGQKVLMGKWPSRTAKDPYPNAIKKPFEWGATSEICDEYLKGRKIVKYGQCWVFGFTLTGLLRSVGIPAREITVIGSGHDVEPEWGVLQTRYVCDKWNGAACEDSRTISSQEQWNFHAWNEVWIPSVNPEDGWAGADATPQRHEAGGDQFIGTPSLKAVREFRPPPRGTQLPDADDAVFLYEETNLPWEIWFKGQDNSWFKSSSGSATATHGFVSNAALQRSDELRNYGVAPVAPVTVWRVPFDFIAGAFKRFVPPVIAQQAPALQITVGPVVNLQTNATVRVSATGLGPAPSRLGFAVLHLPRELSGGTPEGPLPGGMVFAAVLDVTPTGGTWTGTVEVPGSALSVAGAYEVVVGPQEGATGPSGRQRFDVRGLPIAVSIPARVVRGSTFAMSANLVNSTNAPVRAATLRLVLPSQLRIVDGTASGAQDVIPPAGSLRLDAMVQAVSAGSFLAGAASESSAGPSEAHAPIVVSQAGKLSVAGQPALGVTVGQPITLTADVTLEAVEPSGEAEARLGPSDDPSVSILSDARKTTSSLEPEDRWTPSWQVQVASPGTYRLPVRVATAGVGEAVGEILLVAGANDPDEDATDDFGDENLPDTMSYKAVGGVVVVIAGLLGALIYVVRRRRMQHS